jgi:gas vesicle protein
MSDSPEQIRANIEASRRELSSDVDALADKVTPSKIAERQTEKVKGALGGIRDKVMGAASDAKSNVAGTGGSVGDSVSGQARNVADKASGNPFAVGLIAFGVGLLASSLIPASTKEKEVAADIKDKAQPLVENVQDVAKDVAGNLKEPAQQAAAAVKDTASDAVGTVKEEASSATSDLKDSAGQARHVVQDEA